MEKSSYERHIKRSSIKEKTNGFLYLILSGTFHLSDAKLFLLILKLVDIFAASDINPSNRA